MAEAIPEPEETAVVPARGAVPVVGAEVEVEATVVVAALSVDDATAVVSVSPVAGATAVVPELPVDDATAVVAASPVDDATAVVAAPVALHSVGTSAVSSAALPVVPAVVGSAVRAEKPVLESPVLESPVLEIEDATRVTPRPRSGEAGQPVEEPEIPRDLAALMFKSPLDPHRRAPESPFPQADHTLPKTGVRPGMPVVYGARPEVVDEYSSEAAALDAQIGPPPADGFVVPAQREGLPSVAKQNRKFRAIAFGGGAAVLLIVVFGLWGVAGAVFSG